MRCCMCNRPLLTPTASIASRRGPLHYGPDCAKRAGLKLETARRMARRFKAPKPERDPDQFDLFGVAYV